MATFEKSEHPTNDLASFSFELNRPTPETAKALKEELLFHKGTQAYLWSMPMINVLGMKFGSEEQFGAGYNVLPIWKERLDTKTKVTTPNSDLLYAMSYIDMSETGPIVLEIPENQQDILMDFWQRPIPVDGGEFAGDVGFFGPDQGSGGKFLVVPPGYEGEVPSGYFVYRSGMNNLFVFLRAFYNAPNDLQPTVDLMEQTTIYPLNVAEADRLPMEYPNASGVDANLLPRSDFSAFEQLKWLIDREGRNIAGPDGLGILANIGLIEGVPFEPSDEDKANLDKAANIAYKMSRAVAFSGEVGSMNFEVWNDRQWVNPFNNAENPTPEKPLDLSWRSIEHRYTALDPRVWMFTNYYSLSPGMVSQTPGKGASYWIAFDDANGDPLSGDKSYKVTLPPNVPAKLFWSLTLYEAENASGLATDQKRFPSIGQLDNPVINDDGTIDLYIGPVAPEGKEANWQPTAPGRGFFGILRLYGPEQAGIDFSWKPSDFEPID